MWLPRSSSIRPAARRSRSPQSGIALVTTLLVLLLISAMAVGLAWLTMTDQQLGGNNGDRQSAFYAAEAGMEKLTADLGALFSTNYAPTAAQVNALMIAPPSLFGVQYLSSTGAPGYSITFTPDSNGNPLAQNNTILSGPYQGLTALITPYSLTVTTRTTNSSEVKLTRSVETVGIPVFQFGVFSQTDLSFFAGPDFSFGGRVHTNGNLWLAEGNGATLTISDKVTAVGEVIRTNLANGWATSSNYNGAADILTVANGNSYAPLLMSQGSVVGNLGTAANLPTWTQVSLGTYNGNIRNWRTGAVPLILTIATPSLGGSPVDVIRRPVQGEDGSNPSKLGERYYSQASFRILLSDNPADISSLPCTDSSKSPVNLSTLAVPLVSLPSWYTANPRLPLPISAAASSSYSATDGYWIPVNQPIITGFIKIEEQTSYGSPCGTWKDVTQEILNLGFAGRNLNPLSVARRGSYPIPPAVPPLPGSQLAPSACTDVSPNAVIRLERVRDNPSSTSNGGCGGTPTSPTDYWPNALFDTREGNPRDSCPNNSNPCNAPPSVAGVMYYVELDAANLVKWFTGAIGSSGPASKDPVNSPNDFVVYFSDRRTNYIASPPSGGWPPASPSQHETGEYGAFDFVNPSSSFGCPNLSLDTGEDLDSLGLLFNYGQLPYPYPSGTFLTGAPTTSGSTVLYKLNCTVSSPSPTWPGLYFRNSQEARENPPLFFRRALKIVNASSLNLGLCPSGVNCGLTIATENPVYIHGNFNAPGGNFTSPYGATSVIADAITLLSSNWNDVNSFAFPYTPSSRAAVTTAYRFAAESGKGLSFPQPGSTPQDFGTDGGVHNFLRYLESWSGQTLNYRGSLVSFYYNRQAVGLYKCCNTVYTAPTRGYNFDTDFLTPGLLPPRTPMFRDVNTIGFTQLLLPSQ